MNETEMFAAIGRKQTELDTLNSEYDRLLSLLSQVISGEVPADRVSVNLHGRSWEIAAEQESRE